MKVLTTRFGEVEVPDDAKVSFPDGIMGFNARWQYVLLKATELGLFRWLQSTEIPGLAFVVCDPRLIVPDYNVEVRAEELKDIEVGDASEAEVMVILTNPDDKTRMTANLQGPIIYNSRKHLAKQIVLAEDTYSCCHRVFADDPVEPVRSVHEIGAKDVA